MKRKVKLIGYLLRHNDFITDILEGKIIIKQPKERPRQSNFKDINQQMSFTSCQQLKIRRVIEEIGYYKTLPLEIDDEGQQQIGNYSNRVGRFHQRT